MVRNPGSTPIRLYPNPLPPPAKVYRHRDVGFFVPRVNFKTDFLAPDTKSGSRKIRSHSRLGNKMAVPISICIKLDHFTIGQVGLNIDHVAPAILEQGSPSRDNFPVYDRYICRQSGRQCLTIIPVILDQVGERRHDQQRQYDKDFFHCCESG